TYSKMVQNLWWAAGYNIIALPLAASSVNLNPAIGAIVMSLSTVIVAFNAQTLRKYEQAEVKLMAKKKNLVTDPVCGMKIEPETAYSKIEHEEQMVYFCSKHCEEEFKKNPKKYKIRK
ncbi:MAG: YHS domain-containing protein, partial [Candidatus Bathycorpusculaceae bacterium]